MHTDSIFYRLFQERPATVFELAGLAVPAAGAYRMRAEEVKQTAFRLDGVLLPEPEAQHLIAEAPRQPRHDPLIDLIETILVYKFPKLSRAEIKAMLHLPVTDPKQTRYYQDAFQDGELALILRQLQRRFGPLAATRRQQVEGLASADLDALGDALFDFGGLADLERWLDGRRGG